MLLSGPATVGVTTRITVALAKPGWKAQYLAPCAEDLAPTQSCVAEIVRGFGGRVWRRDLSEAEVQRYVEQTPSAIAVPGHDMDAFEDARKALG